MIDDLGSAGSDHYRTWLFLERVGLAEVFEVGGSIFCFSFSSIN
jgi:hypothetical protein